MRKRIVHELNTLDVGGAETYALAIAKNVKRYDHVVIAHAPGPMQEKFLEAGVQVFIGEDFEFDDETDIAHAHVGGGPLSPVLRLCLQSDAGRNIPAVATVHACGPWTEPQHVHLADELAGFVSVSEVVRAANPTSIVIPPGLDMSRLTMTDEPKSSHSEALRVGYLGRLSPEKNLELLIEGMYWLQKSGGLGRSVSLFVAGQETAPGYVARLRRGIQMIAAMPEYGFGLNVVFLGGPVMPGEFFGLIDVLASTSPSEAFGMTFIEGMAAGVPVVGSTMPATTALLPHIETSGLTRASVGMAIKRASERSPERLQAAREFATTEFSLKRMVASYESLYGGIT